MEESALIRKLPGRLKAVIFAKSSYALQVEHSIIEATPPRDLADLTAGETKISVDSVDSISLLFDTAVQIRSSLAITALDRLDLRKRHARAEVAVHTTGQLGSSQQGKSFGSLLVLRCELRALVETAGKVRQPV